MDQNQNLEQRPSKSKVWYFVIGAVVLVALGVGSWLYITKWYDDKPTEQPSEPGIDFDLSSLNDGDADAPSAVKVSSAAKSDSVAVMPTGAESNKADVVKEKKETPSSQKVETVKEKPKVEKKKEEKGNNEVYTVVDEMPKFPGGDSGLYSFIASNLNYPAMAIENNVQGRVVVQFVVKKDGSIGDVTVKRSVDRDLDREAVRICKKLPKFIPGKLNGQPVNVTFTLPINFRLSN